MHRRHFIKNTTLTGGALALTGSSVTAHETPRLAADEAPWFGRVMPVGAACLCGNRYGQL